MAFESAAGRMTMIAREGPPRPLVTDRELVVVELPLSGRPGQLWQSIFAAKKAGYDHPQVGWVNIHDAADGSPTVTFELKDIDGLLDVIADVERELITATTAAWVADPTVAPKVARQVRIDALQAELDDVVATSPLESATDGASTQNTPMNTRSSPQAGSAASQKVRLPGTPAA